jgi:hypothetical protein
MQGELSVAISGRDDISPALRSTRLELEATKRQLHDAGIQSDILRDRFQYLRQQQALGLITKQRYRSELRALQGEMVQLARTTKLGAEAQHMLAQSSRSVAAEIRAVDGQSMRVVGAMQRTAFGAQTMSLALSGGRFSASGLSAALLTLGPTSPAIIGLTSAFAIGATAATAISAALKNVGERAREARDRLAELREGLVRGVTRGDPLRPLRDDLSRVNAELGNLRNAQRDAQAELATWRATLARSTGQSVAAAAVRVETLEKQIVERDVEIRFRATRSKQLDEEIRQEARDQAREAAQAWVEGLRETIANAPLSELRRVHADLLRRLTTGTAEQIEAQRRLVGGAFLELDEQLQRFVTPHRVQVPLDVQALLRPLQLGPIRRQADDAITRALGRPYSVRPPVDLRADPRRVDDAHVRGALNDLVRRWGTPLSVSPAVRLQPTVQRVDEARRAVDAVMRLLAAPRSLAPPLSMRVTLRGPDDVAARRAVDDVVRRLAMPRALTFPLRLQANVQGPDGDAARRTLDALGARLARPLTVTTPVALRPELRSPALDPLRRDSEDAISRALGRPVRATPMVTVRPGLTIARGYLDTIRDQVTREVGRQNITVTAPVAVTPLPRSAPIRRFFDDPVSFEQRQRVSELEVGRVVRDAQGRVVRSEPGLAQTAPELAGSIGGLRALLGDLSRALEDKAREINRIGFANPFAQQPDPAAAARERAGIGFDDDRLRDLFGRTSIAAMSESHTAAATAEEERRRAARAAILRQIETPLERFERERLALEGLGLTTEQYSRALAGLREDMERATQGSQVLGISLVQAVSGALAAVASGGSAGGLLSGVGGILGMKGVAGALGIGTLPGALIGGLGMLVSAVEGRDRRVRIDEYSQRAIDQMRQIDRGPESISVTVVAPGTGETLSHAEYELRRRERLDRHERLPAGTRLG